MRTAARCAGVLLLPIALNAQPVAKPALSIGRVDTVWSAVLKEKRPVLIYKPPSYSDTTYTPRTYPVLYVLDGDAHFHSVTGLIQILATGVNGTYVIPEMIVVAISNTNRMRDLSPTNTTVDHNGVPTKEYGGGGGVAHFLRFIKSELIPHIDSAYRSAPYRLLIGHSWPSPTPSVRTTRCRTGTMRRLCSSIAFSRRTTRRASAMASNTIPTTVTGLCR